MSSFTQTQHALRPLPKDDRDIKLGDIVTLPALSELPISYTVGLPTVINQDTPLNPNTDFCAAVASSVVVQLREGVDLGYEWAFAVAKMISGDLETFGTDLRTMCQVYVKYGIIERSQSPFSMATQSSEFLRNIQNWPSSLFKLALKHQQGSFLSVSGPYDNFDNIRAIMWKFSEEGCGVLFGVLWGWSLSQVVMNTSPVIGSGHALAQIGWDAQGMFIQNSAGPEAGVGGRHYFTRDVINHFVDMYGAFIFHPLPPKTIQAYVTAGISLDDGFISKTVKVILWAISNLIRLV